MSLQVEIVYQSFLSELLLTYPQFRKVQQFSIPEISEYRWERGKSVSHDIQVIFIGKSGYGKSTTINKIVGKDVLQTDSVRSCTKKLFSAEFQIWEGVAKFLSLGDLPGVGESIEADKKYVNLYQLMLSKTNCIVYILRADQRDYSVDEEIFKNLLKNEKNKLVIGLNYADKIEPICRGDDYRLSNEQKNNLDLKVRSVSRRFSCQNEFVVGYSAEKKYNLDWLVRKIVEILEKQFT